MAGSGKKRQTWRLSDTAGELFPVACDDHMRRGNTLAGKVSYAIDFGKCALRNDELDLAALIEHRGGAFGADIPVGRNAPAKVVTAKALVGLLGPNFIAASRRRLDLLGSVIGKAREDEIATLKILSWEIERVILGGPPDRRIRRNIKSYPRRALVMETLRNRSPT